MLTQAWHQGWSLDKEQNGGKEAGRGMDRIVKVASKLMLTLHDVWQGCRVSYCLCLKILPAEAGGLGGLGIPLLLDLPLCVLFNPVKHSWLVSTVWQLGALTSMSAHCLLTSPLPLFSRMRGLSLEMGSFSLNADQWLECGRDGQKCGVLDAGVSLKMQDLSSWAVREKPGLLWAFI